MQTANRSRHDVVALATWAGARATWAPPRHAGTNRLSLGGGDMSTKAVISLTTGLEDPGHAAGRHIGPARRRPMIRGGIMDIVTIKQRQQAAWASGDYAAVGARFCTSCSGLA